jgi:hypothetical protein
VRGTTLLETLVGAFVLSLLFVCLFFTYRVGASAWKKGETETDLLQNLQVAKSRLTRELERSVYDSVSVDPNGIAFLSALDVYGDFQMDNASSTPRWQKYVVVYYDAPARILRWQEIPVVGTPQEMNPTPIESFGAANPLTSYFNSGREFMRDVETCVFQWTPDLLVGFTWATEKKRYGKNTPDRIEIRSAVGFRN